LRASAPNATPTGPAGSVRTSRAARAARLVIEVLIRYASWLKLVACSAASTSGVFGPKKLTVPLFSKGRILVSCGQPPLSCSVSLFSL